MHFFLRTVYRRHTISNAHVNSEQKLSRMKLSVGPSIVCRRFSGNRPVITPDSVWFPHPTAPSSLPVLLVTGPVSAAAPPYWLIHCWTGRDADRLLDSAATMVVQWWRSILRKLGWFRRGNIYSNTLFITVFIQNKSMHHNSRLASVEKSPIFWKNVSIRTAWSLGMSIWLEISIFRLRLAERNFTKNVSSFRLTLLTAYYFMWCFQYGRPT